MSSTDRDQLRQEVQDARQAMISTCEAMREGYILQNLPLKRDAFLCGAACIDAKPATLADLNQCIATCQDKVTRVENVSRTYLDAVSDRVELCLSRCYGETPKNPEAWEKLNHQEFFEKLGCAKKCYLEETEWIRRQNPRWGKRVDAVINS
jgi:Eukaryotic protein of unknown function (DUF842)